MSQSISGRVCTCKISHNRYKWQLVLSPINTSFHVTCPSIIGPTIETRLLTPQSSPTCSPFGNVLLDSEEQKCFDQPLPHDLFRVVCAVQSMLNGVSANGDAEHLVLTNLLRRAVAQCDSILKERIDNNQGLDSIHYIYILVRNIRKLYRSKKGKPWQLCSLEAGKTEVRMVFILGKDCEILMSLTLGDSRRMLLTLFLNCDGDS